MARLKRRGWPGEFHPRLGGGSARRGSGVLLEVAREARDVPVSGRVLYEGNPATGAVVILHAIGGAATGERPRAKADGKGEFTLSTFTNGDGAPAGEYAVTVEWKRSDDHPEQGADLLPAAYSDPKTTKLKATITAGTNEALVLKLSRRP